MTHPATFKNQTSSCSGNFLSIEQPRRSSVPVVSPLGRRFNSWHVCRTNSHSTLVRLEKLVIDVSDALREKQDSPLGSSVKRLFPETSRSPSTDKFDGALPDKMSLAAACGSYTVCLLKNPHQRSTIRTINRTGRRTLIANRDDSLRRIFTLPPNAILALRNRDGSVFFVN